VEVSEKLKLLTEQVNRFAARYDSAQSKTLETIGAHKFFSKHLIETIQKAFNDNAMTPAVVQRLVNELSSQRQTYIQDLESITKNFAAIGIEADNLKAGEAEIGFKIPRELFHDELKGLIDELSVINMVIRAFSEATSGKTEAIKVRQISTSDPQFFFGLDPLTIVAIGTAVKWALSQWREIEEIRRVRAETRKLSSFSGEDIEAIFDNKIKQTIDKAIAEKADEIIGKNDGQAGRGPELRNHLAWALKSILARVERGMTVEIRFLSPPEPQTSEGSAENKEAAAFTALQEIAPKLVFPPADPTPILSLPPTKPEDSEEKGGKKK